FAAQCHRADERSLVELHHRIESCLENRRGLVDVVAVEKQARLQAKSVAGPQPTGKKPLRRAGAKEKAEEIGRGLGRSVALESILAGVAGARHEAVRSGDRGLDAVEGADQGEA